MYKNFPKRLERDVKRLVKDRFDLQQAKYPGVSIKPIECNVVTHRFQRFAVWFGGSLLASQADFLGYFHTKANYQELGPRVARHNQVFAQC